MVKSGYMNFYKHAPDLNGDEFLFVSNDKIWLGNLKDSTARVIVSNEGIINNARFSPDGSKIVFRSMKGKDASIADLFMYDRSTSEVRRITYLNGKSVPRRMFTDIAGWSDETPIISTDAFSPFGALTFLYQMNLKTLNLSQMKYGPAAHILFHNDRVIIGRYTYDMPHWKGYKGGTKGVIWSGKVGKEFKKIVDVQGHVSSPCILEGKVFFISDHEGMGQIYSVDLEGKNLKKYTDFKTHYPRHLSSNGQLLMFSTAGEIFTLKVSEKKEKRVEIKMESGVKLQKTKFPATETYLEEYSLNGIGEIYGFSIRGKGIVVSKELSPQIEIPVNGRARLIKFLSEKRVAFVNQDLNGERLYISEIPDLSKYTKMKEDIGLIDDIFPSPDGKFVAITNILFQLYIVNTETMKAELIDQSEAGKVRDVVWSPDSKKIAYTYSYMTGGFGQRDGTVIRIADLETKEKTSVTEKSANDFSPTFDPSGSFLFYLSDRTFDPVADKATFNYSFPLMTKPYFIRMGGKQMSPVRNIPDSMLINERREESLMVSEPLPLESGDYSNMCAVNGGLIFISRAPEGLLKTAGSGRQRDGVLTFFSFEAAKARDIASKVIDYEISGDGNTIVFRRDKNKLFRMQSKKKKDEIVGFEDETELKLSKVKVRIEPMDEWRQMFNETWLLAKNYFWKEDFVEKSSKLIYERYSPLVNMITTRYELSEIIREMQGEFRTSHSYETGGDFLCSDIIQIGRLGADFEPREGRFVIKKIYHGDLSNEREKSPLLIAGFQEGDQILRINGKEIKSDNDTIENALLGLPNDLLRIDAKTKKGKSYSNYVETIPDDRYLRYRDWVENNRRMVHEETDGKVGYVHLPNMMLDGLAEFYRLYTREFKKFGLIVDVRFNGGGNVSQLILEKLLRERIAVTHPRLGQDSPYPSYSVEGPIVALTNENAGSDGDIFSHSFKLLSLGPLIGTRTWGGVIGISPERMLTDRTMVTQPRFGMKFKDVGFGVENYGTDPSFEIEISPEDWYNEKDPQMELGLKKIMEMIKISEKSTKK
jgi:tricorn protease